MNNFIKLLNAKKKFIKYESLYVNKTKRVFIIFLQQKNIFHLHII